jgi:hypothetical protein
MDHIIRPGTGWPREIPYLFDESCPYIYDNKYWPKFPERMGWTVNEVINFRLLSPSSTPEHTVQRAASLIQAWLFFGLIGFFTGTDVDTGKYVVVNSEKKKVITTGYLPFQLELWRQKTLSKIQGAYVDDHYSAWANIVKTVSRTIRMAVTGAVGGVVPLEVNFSISVLFRTILVFHQTIFTEYTLPQEIVHPDCRDELLNLLESKGWSKCDRRQSGNSFSALTLYYIGTAVERLTSGNHSECNGSTCALIEKPTENIVPKHVTNDCQCDFIGPSENRIIDSIRNHLLPVLSYSEDSGWNVQDHDLDREDCLPYVAISHVWSHGLGNPKNNRMHICQVTAIQRKVSALVSRGRCYTLAR